MTARLAGWTALAVVVGLLGCRVGERARPAGRVRPQPVLALAGQSYARWVGADAAVTQGTGAEARPGDVLLENEVVRFVIAGLGHGGPRFVAGNVIDAAVQGGEDRMRLLAPLLGPGVRVPPVFTRLRVAEAGGLDETAAVVAEGHLPGHPDVKVTSMYSLPPAEEALQVTTAVENAAQATLAGVALGDRLYVGRTLRYVPGAGLMPSGQTTSNLLCFFWRDRSWGLLCGPVGRMQAVHEPGVSEVLYATVDVPPEGVQSYTRYLAAAPAGPEAMWQAAYPVPDLRASTLQFDLQERVTGRPVAGAQVVVSPSDGRPEAVLFSDAGGRAEMKLRAGTYSVEVRPVGRASQAVAELACIAGRTHCLTLTFPPRTEAVVSVSARIGEFVAPAAARISCYQAGKLAAPYPPALPFPDDGASGEQIVDGLTERRLPLTPWRVHSAAPYLLVGSRGPLFDLALLPVEADPGRAVPRDMYLSRVVDPGEYVGVDFRQHTAASLDCALTLEERALGNACEGLDAAIVSDTAPALPGGRGPVSDASGLLSGLRLTLDGTGCFSVYPLSADQRSGDDGAVRELLAWAEPGRPAGEVLAQVRRLFPEALVQVDAPLAPGRGYFALSGFVPETTGLRPGALSPDFDALEVLSGRDVAAARRALKCWFALLNDGRRVLATGGSGSRAVTGDPAGIARTYVHCPAPSEGLRVEGVAGAVRALKQAPNAFVTNGPFLEATLDGHPIGSVHTPSDGVARLHLRVRAPLWVDVTKATVYRNGEVAGQLDVPSGTGPLRCDRVLDLPATEDCWFVVVVEGRRPMAPVYSGGLEAPTPFAVTNPFWVDADGDGEVRIGGAAGP